MDDQSRMRVRDCAGDLRDERDPGAHVELVLAAVDVDRLAFDVLEREIRPAVLRDARVVQASDVRMLERREDLALLSRALGELRQRPPVRQLQCDLSPQDAVGALRQPYGAHAAFADRAEQTVRADHAADDGRWCDRRRAVGCRVGGETREVFQEIVGLVLRMLLEQGRQGRLETRLGGVQRREPGLALLDRKLEACLQEREDFLEISGREILHEERAGRGFEDPGFLHGSRRLLNPYESVAGQPTVAPRRVHLPFPESSDDRSRRIAAVGRP